MPMIYNFVPDTPGPVGPNGIDPTLLRYQYFAQLTPDKQRLVPGILYQGTPSPAVSGRLDVGDVTRDFQKRYFVQYTDFNTLVPGSLIQAEKLPPGKWKEIKKRMGNNFHHVYYTEGYEIGAYPGDQEEFLTSAEFIPDILYPVLDHYYPGLRDSETVYCDMYYFRGTYAALGENVENLVPFSEPDSFFLITFDGDPVSTINTSQTGPEVATFFVQPDAEDGGYCIILGVQNVNGVSVEYIVLEHALVKYTPSGD